ncbi:hypothetical protein ASF84_17325 [Pseudomonas sp. Leaf127]|uniref:DUF6508 domain-containing protein n=1 Tax=Pseudomonas sp. Leaf127 TaxID=1736267 RepID=UPI000702D55B|nr:DUF6508 domain-containing protein [Pseudomonas sp. Leaf127]KQQ53578.1 hypothetical protein ASF84_17325 [Pseudomonas sp. Leaf127]
MPSLVAQLKAWLGRAFKQPRPARHDEHPVLSEPWHLMPPALPPLHDTDPPLIARYDAFIASAAQRVLPADRARFMIESKQLARDLSRHATHLGNSKAYENSPDIYWLMQAAATVSMLSSGARSIAFQGYYMDVNAYRRAPLTAGQVQVFDDYQARIAAHEDIEFDYAQPRPEDIDELLYYLPRLYPQGVAIKTSFFTDNTQWPRYVEVVEAFYKAAGQTCWTDLTYDIQRSGERIVDRDYVAAASLDELKSLLTWCVRGERFSDGHHGWVIEQGYVLGLLQRLAVLRREGSAGS